MYWPLWEIDQLISQVNQLDSIIGNKRGSINKSLTKLNATEKKFDTCDLLRMGKTPRQNLTR